MGVSGTERSDGDRREPPNLDVSVGVGACRPGHPVEQAELAEEHAGLKVAEHAVGVDLRLLHLEAHLPLIYQVAVITRGPFLDDARALGKRDRLHIPSQYRQLFRRQLRK